MRLLGRPIPVEKAQAAGAHEPIRPAPVRWSGLCLIGAGIQIAGSVLHPDIFDTTLAQAALETPLWVEGHGLWLLAAVLSLFGLAGLYARQAGQIGTLGLVGIAITVPGLVVTACLAFAEAFIVPVVARANPELLDWEGPLLTSDILRVTAGLAGLWFLGLLLVGLATWHANILPRGAAASLAVGAPAFAIFEGPFIPVLGVASVVLLAAAHVWLGYALWSDRAWTHVRSPMPLLLSTGTGGL